MKFRKFSGNISWPVPYEYANEWVDDVIASQFSIHVVHRNDKNFIFQLWECYTCLNYSLNRCRIMLTPIYLGMSDITIKGWGKKFKFSKFYVQNIWQVWPCITKPPKSRQTWIFSYGQILKKEILSFKMIYNSIQLDISNPPK